MADKVYLHMIRDIRILLFLKAHYRSEDFLNMPYITLPVSHQNVSLYYEVHGSGEIKVLLIMGLRTEGRAWKYQVTR